MNLYKNIRFQETDTPTKTQNSKFPPTLLRATADWKKDLTPMTNDNDQHSLKTSLNMPDEIRPFGRQQEARDFFKGRSFVEGQDRLRGDETDLLRVVKTEKTGRGLVAKMPIKEGSRIFGIHGKEETTRQDREHRHFRSSIGEVGSMSAADNPNWNLPNAVCIRQGVSTDGQVMNTWLDPDSENPLRYINHSCSPNAIRMGGFAFVAKRDIASGEPITVDYSTLEVNPKWKMKCECGSDHCRGEILSIQFLTPEQIEPYWDYLPGFAKRLYMSSAKTSYRGEKDTEVLERLEKDKLGFGFEL